MGELEDLESGLKELEREREVLAARIGLLRAEEPKSRMLTAAELCPLRGTPAFDSIPETPNHKIELFLRLFRCRESEQPKTSLTLQSQDIADRFTRCFDFDRTRPRSGVFASKYPSSTGP